MINNGKVGFRFGGNGSAFVPPSGIRVPRLSDKKTPHKKEQASKEQPSQPSGSILTFLLVSFIKLFIDIFFTFGRSLEKAKQQDAVVDNREIRSVSDPVPPSRVSRLVAPCLLSQGSAVVTPTAAYSPTISRAKTN